MDKSDEQSNYTTCPCQHCSGHIKFDPSQLRTAESRTVECPHCHLETILFIPQTTPEGAKATNKRITPQEDDAKEHIGATTMFELFVLQLTRVLTLIGAALVIATLATIVLIFGATLLPEKKEAINTVSYEEITAALQPQQGTPVTHLSYGSEINNAETLPESVANFAGNHPDFKLDVAGMSIEQRTAFLKNLASIIQKANSHNVTDDKMVQMVELYVNMWTAANTSKPNDDSLLAKVSTRAFCIDAAPKLFGAITILCLILILLAIERNIRLIAEKALGSQGKSKTVGN